MLTALEYSFKNAPVKKRIAEQLYKLGVSIKGEKFYIGEFEIPVKVIADVMRVNRKTVYSFLESVKSDYVVREIFKNMKSTPDLTNVAPLLGYEVIVAKVDALTGFRILDYLRARVNLFSYRFSDGELTVIYEPRLDISDIKFISSLVGEVRLITPDTSKQRIICERCKVEYCPRRSKYV